MGVSYIPSMAYKSPKTIKMKQDEIEENLRMTMERIKSIRETKARLSKEEDLLSEPLMDDLWMVGNIYDLFLSYHRSRKSKMVQKQFIFIILYLYSPSALGGSKMRRGLRERIAAVLGCTCSNVSHDYRNISFYYVTYRSFRNEVNAILHSMLGILGLRKED